MLFFFLMRGLINATYGLRHLEVLLGGTISITSALLLRSFVRNGRGTHLLCVTRTVVSNYAGRLRNEARIRMNVRREEGVRARLTGLVVRGTVIDARVVFHRSDYRLTLEDFRLR